MGSPKASRATRWYIAGLCLLGAARIFLGCAGLPLFHDVDEQAHFDLIHKFSRGYWPVQQHENWDQETADVEVLYGSSEFLYTPQRFPGGVYPPPVWTWGSSPERDDYVKRKALTRTRFENHEAHSPPVYYLAGAAWYHLGRRAGLSGASAVYWVRFLNVPLYALLIATAYAFCRAHFSRPVALAVPALVACFPSTVFFGVTSDALSPLVVLLALWLLLRWSVRPSPSPWLSLLAGLTTAAAFLVKLSNVAIVVACGLVVAWRWRQACRTGTSREVRQRGSLLLLGICVPIGCWFLLNEVLLGDLSGTTAKVQSLGWRYKPLGEIFDHPLFSLDGQQVFWGRFVTNFYEGDMNWLGRPTTTSASAKAFSLFSFALLPVALGLGWWRRGWSAPARFPSAGSVCALVFGGSILFLIGQSLAWDFGTGVYPSRTYPYLSSGRLISGAIVPFLALYACGIEVIFNRSRPAIASTMAVSLTLMAVPQATLLSSVAESRYNWFHLFVPGSASDALTGHGLIALYQGRFDEAAARFARESDDNPSNLVALTNLGLVLAAQGKNEPAARVFTRALTVQPQSAELHNSRGVVLAALGAWTAAADDYREAARLSPRAPFYRFPLAHALSKSGRAAEAEREYAAALRLSQHWPRRTSRVAGKSRTPPDRAARMWLAAQAVQRVEQSDGGGNQLEMLEDLAVAYSEAERFEEATATAEYAIQAAKSRGEPDLAARFRERLDNFIQQLDTQLAGRQYIPCN